MSIANVCCYTIDEGYLLPALLSASQLRETVSCDCAIVVFCFGEPSAKSETYRRVFALHGIDFRYETQERIGRLPIMFARFFLDRLLADDEYDNVVYLDADTQVVGDIGPLMGAEVPAGHILAALDPMAIIVQDRLRPRNLSYFASIGIDAEGLGDYSNSGVLRFNLRDWPEIGRSVIAASAKKDHAYRFGDQDPLNLCCRERILTMSYKWNFPSFFLGLDLFDEIQPAVLHFMSRPRPWDGAFAPWGRDYHQPYSALVSRHPDLAAWIKPTSPIKIARYHLQQHVKRLIENPAWRHWSVSQQIAEIEKTCLV